LECLRCRADNPDTSSFCGRCGTPLGPAESAAPTLTKAPLAHGLGVGTVIAGKYRLLGEIGHGGMGVVYKAEDLKLRRLVALKFLPPHLVDEPEREERFLVEARAAAALSHPNVCVVHEIGDSDGRPYIAMEYVEGETLREKVKGSPLSAEEALAIAVQVAAALGETHGKGILHRDIKSANIMVTGKGQAKVMDFGLAKLRGASSLTRSHTTLGTVAYMSPEQARGEELDGRTDVWSLGVVLYEMVTGELPFRGDHEQTVIHSILNSEPKPPSRVREGLPTGVDGVIGRALAKDAAERYPTMEDLRSDLEAVAAGLRPAKARRRVWRTLFGPKRVVLLGAAVIVVAAALVGFDVRGIRGRIFGARGSPEPAVKLAVLPFANLTGDPEQEYLSDGFTQEMITQLGRLHPQSLSVIARTSVMRYKKAEAPVDRIGRELGVDHVLEGSVQREGGRIRIAAELVRVGDQTQLWADSYEREFSGILTVQSQVAQSVAKALALKLLPAQEARLAIVRTINPQAYDAYLKGSSLWQTLRAADVDAAQRAFETALEQDPSYAPAHAGLAWVWLVRQQMGLIPRGAQGGAKAKAAALQALALDDESAEAHEALASILTWRDWDWTAADKEWKRALELNPNSANTHAYYAHYLAHLGRAGDGVSHSQWAIRLDPFNPLYHSLYGMVLVYLRRYDDALAAAHEAIAIRPDTAVAFSVIQRVYLCRGMREEQLAEQRLRIAGDPERVAAFDRGLAECGYECAQRGVAGVLARRYAKGLYHSACGIALRYLDAGDKEEALQWLYRAYEDRDQNLPYVGEPEWKPLYGDLRYQALVRRVGLPVPGGG
jgi:TolB-like protein/Tfp pilus assembly protein PilF/predicted Ser/Thr protein kinase